MSVFEAIIRKAGEVYNFTKDRLRLSLSSSRNLLNLHNTYFQCACSWFFHYHVMPRFLLLEQEYVVCIYFDRDTGRSLLSIFFNNISSRSSNNSCKCKFTFLWYQSDTRKSVFFAQFLVKVWDQNTLHCLSEKEMLFHCSQLA